MIRKRLLWGILIAVGCAVVFLIVAVATREREPEYGGRKLSEWVELHAANPPRNHPEQKAEAADAIRQVGDRALPYLLKWIRYEPVRWKSTLYEDANPILHRVNSSWHLTDEPERKRAGAAAVAFEALGQQAAGAIGELTRILNDTNLGPARFRNLADGYLTPDRLPPYRAVNALARLGEIGMAPLHSFVTNKQGEAGLRYLAARNLILHRAEDQSDALRTLQELSTGPDASVGKFAAEFLLNHPRGTRILR